MVKTKTGLLEASYRIPQAKKAVVIFLLISFAVKKYLIWVGVHFGLQTAQCYSVVAVFLERIIIIDTRFIKIF